VKEVCDNVIYRNSAKAHAEKHKGQQHNGLSAVLVILTRFYHKMKNIELIQEPSAAQKHDEELNFAEPSHE